MKKPIFALLCLTTALSPARGAVFLQDYTNAANGIDLRAGFIPDATRIVVGEPMFLTFVVSNHSAQPFEFQHVRNDIFSVTATNGAGQGVKSRYFGMDGNGYVTRETVRPGEGYARRIFLNERCQFEEPGDYQVTCRCDFGRFSNRSNVLGRPIVTAFTLSVLPANPQRMAEIVQAWGQVIQANGALNEAAQALAEIDDPQTIPLLASLVAKDASSYIAVQALARFTNAAAADGLLPVLRHGEDYVAGIAREGLSKSHQNDRAARQLLPELESSDPVERIRTARALGWTGSALAFAPLYSVLQSETGLVRYAAATAIGRSGDARSFDVLTHCLSDPDFALRLAAVNGLRALGRPLQAAWVKPMIVSGGENIPTFYEAIDLLRIHGGEQAAPGLASCLHFDDPSVRHPYNFRLILALEYSPNGPQYFYKWHHDPNRDGTQAELVENRQVLSDLKAWLSQQTRNQAGRDAATPSLHRATKSRE